MVRSVVKRRVPGRNASKQLPATGTILPGDRLSATNADSKSLAADAEDNPGLLLADLVHDDAITAEKASSRLEKASRPKGKMKNARIAAARGKKKSAGNLDGEIDENGLGGYDGEDEDAIADVRSFVDRLAVDGSAPPIARKRNVMQGVPESEFNSGGVKEKISIEDLLAPLEETPAFGDVRKQLESLARTEPMPEPVSEVKRSREDRKVQYDSSAKDAGKWIPQVQRNRRADQVVLGEEENPEEHASMNSLVGTTRAANDFEKELEAITQAAGATETELKGAKILPMNSRLRDEKQRQQVARLKSLIFREQQTHKRVKKIKSKTYRKIHRKAETREREVLLGRLEVENPELAKTLKEEYEKKHALSRLQRQKNARKKWTQTMQRFAKGDKSAQKEITKQAQDAHDEDRALRRAVRGQRTDQSEDSEAVDLSGTDSDGEPGNRGVAKSTLTKAKRLTVGELKNLEDGGELPTTGILGMNFMRDAINKRRETAKKEAQGVLQELEGMDRRLDRSTGKGDGDSEDGSEDDNARKADAPNSEAQRKAPEKKRFTEEELAAAREQVGNMLDNDADMLECGVSGPLTVHSVAAAAAPLATGTSAPSSIARQKKKQSTGAKLAPAARPDVAVENPWEDAGGGDLAGGVGATPVDGSAAASVAALYSCGIEMATPAPTVGAPANADSTKHKNKKERKQERKANANKAPDEPEALVEARGQSSEDVLNILNADSEAAREQRDIVRTAFVEGTQIDDFEEEQEKLAEDKDDRERNKTSELAGWGHWTGDCAPVRKPKRNADPKAEEASKRPRTPARVTILQGDAALNADKASAKYFVDKVPHPFQSPAQYEQQLRMPSGPEWNTLPQHLERIKPKMFVKVGAIVPPLQYVKHLPPERRDSALDVWSSGKQAKRIKARM